MILIMAKTSKGMAAGSYRSVGKTYDGVTILQPKTKPTHTTTAKIRSTIKDVVGNLYVERRPDGNYAVRRVSVVTPTQKEAIARARELAPGKQPSVERSHSPEKGGTDKFRKA
jgi:hypothetical protein